MIKVVVQYFMERNWSTWRYRVFFNTFTTAFKKLSKSTLSNICLWWHISRYWMVRYSLGFFFVYSWIYSIYYWMSTLDVNICWVYFNLQMKYRHNKTARKYKQVQKHFIYQFRISFKQINTNYPKKKICDAIL